MKKIALTHLPVNKKAIVQEIQGGPGVQNKLMVMGIYPGREIIKHGHFILKGPVAIKVGRSVLALGFSLADKIIVEPR